MFLAFTRPLLRAAVSVLAAVGFALAAQTAGACEQVRDWLTIQDQLKDGNNRDALRLAESCLTKIQQDGERSALETARFLNLVGRARRGLDQPAAAEKAHLAALAVLRKVPRSDESSRRILRSVWHSLAELYKITGQHRQTVKAQTEKLKLLGEAGNDAFSRVLAWMDIGDAHLALGDRDAAKSAYQRGVDNVESVPEQIRAVPLFVHHRLARLYRFEERYSKSEAILEDGLAQMERIFGTQDQGTIHFYEALGWTYYFQFRYQDAEAMADIALAHYDRADDGYPDAPVGAMTLKARLLDTRPWKAREALALFTETLALRETAAGPQSPLYASGLVELLEHHLKHRGFARAEQLAREALPIYERYFDDGALWIGRLNHFLAEALHGKGRDAEALPHALKANEIQRQALPPYHTALGKSLALLSEIHAGLGQTADQRRVRAELAAYYEERAAFMSGAD